MSSLLSGGLQPDMASQPLVPSSLSTSLWYRATSRPPRWTITWSRIRLSPSPRNLNRRAAHVAANGLSPTYRQTERTSRCAGPLRRLAAEVDCIGPATGVKRHGSPIPKPSMPSVSVQAEEIRRPPPWFRPPRLPSQRPQDPQGTKGVWRVFEGVLP